MRVALFITCVNDLMYPETGKAVVTLLERLGVTVEFPEAQTCCGQMHANSGYRDEALPMVRNYLETFKDYDAVVSPSGSCAAMVRESYPSLVDGAQDVADKTYELSEFIVDVLGVTDVGARFPQRVTYHPTCHGLRALRLGDRPLSLLRAVRDIDLVELPGAEECCGFGGTFALKNSGVSSAMLQDKCAAIHGTGAAIVAAADNSCLTHIGGGLSRQGGRSGGRSGGAVRAMHYAEILAAS
jgi:L-lactate dehydrogenase complex protein LldE